MEDRGEGKREREIGPAAICRKRSGFDLF